MYNFKNWRHVFKLDPSKPLSDSELEQICESGTDAVIVGGTDNVSLDNVLEYMVRIRRYTVPCVLEVSNIESITPGFDLYFIPSVLNSREPKWINGFHHQAVKEFGEIMNWDEIVMEGYCVLNKDCKVAQVTNSNTELDLEDILAYARMAEKMFSMPIFYLEYSGKYGDSHIVKEVKSVLSDTRLFYGGGIHSAKQASEMGQFADVVVVGNAIYENFKEALNTVNAVKQVT